MKLQKTLPALVLTVAMMLSMVTPAWAAGNTGEAADSAVTGSVQATVRLDYAQTLEEIKEREVKAELFKDTTSLMTVDLADPQKTTLGGYEVTVSHREAAQGDLPDGSADMTLDLTVTGLPKGKYALRFTGTGYVERKVEFEITSYNKYIEVGTGDYTFTLGDFDGNGKVDETDREALSKALGSTDPKVIETYDLSGDGKIDIVDLAYVNHNVKAFSSKISPVCLDTECFEVDLDEATMRSDLEINGTTTEDSIFGILRDDGNSPATFKSDSEKIMIPVPLTKAVVAENIQIMTPSDNGTIQKGTVYVEQEDSAETLQYRFDETVPEGVHALTRSAGNNIITINLGKRVAVKKITISVTKQGNGDYATVESIQFLKDVVGKNLVEPNSKVKLLSAEAGDSLVNLTWPELPNVSSYRIDYWEEGKESSSRQLSVDINEAQVTGLENLKYYVFTVTPTDGTWEGQPSDPVTAMPQPTKVPPPPDMVSVTALDKELAISWKEGKNVTYYEVYYTDKANAEISDYKQYGERLTDPKKPTVTMKGLTNDTTYYIYIVAGNDVGKSGPSRIASGTPKEVKYEMPAGIPKDALLNSSMIKSVALAAPNNVNTAEYTTENPFNVRNIIDGNYKTHWTAGKWSGNEHVIVEFQKPVDLYGAIWVPRLDGPYPNYLRAYSVRVWYEGEENGPGQLLTKGTDDGSSKDTDVWTWPDIPNRGQIPTSKFAIMPFDTAKKVVKISVAAEQAGYNIVSCSELMFLEYDAEKCLPDQIAKLFDVNDPLYTTLADGVIQAKIEELKQRLNNERSYYLNPNTLADELNLAEELLAGKNTGVVLDGLQAPAGNESHGQGGSNLQPLGVTAKAGQEITIYASGIPEGKSVPIYASQFNAEVSAWKASVGEVKNGRNILIVPRIGSQNTERGGSLYYTYDIPKDATAETVKNEAAGIKLHVRRAVDIPVLQLADWYQLEGNDTERIERIKAYLKELNDYVTAQNITNANATTRTTNVTEISTPSVLLSIPAAAVVGKTETDLYNSILAWEDVMHICKTTQGIDKTYEQNDMPTRQNIRCMQMFAGAFMYAAGNHIGIGYGSCGGMVSGIPIDKNSPPTDANHLFGWGIAHEIGHNMDKLGKAEITNNIYSLMVQTYDGKSNTLPSRLELSGKYPEIFNKVAQGYPGASNNVFVQLGMYWQLHLAYDGAENPMDFYNRFFTAWKQGDSNEYLKGMTGLSYDERFALTASGVAGKNLTEFFERWGMTLSGPVVTELKAYEKEPRAIWYLNDQSRRDIIAGKTTQTGTLNVTAEVQADKDNEVKNNVVLTITTSGLNTDVNNKISPVQGYEILRDGKSIAFTTDTTYTDIIGSANHRTYTYSVVAYDTCGNKLAEGSAGEVRIAYDKLVPAKDYTMTRSGSTVTIQFAEATSISGLKLSGTNCPTSGSYSISIEAEFTNDDKAIETKTVEARSGSFNMGNQAVDDKNCYLTYFQKPGVGNDDTRIWTYDAKTVTITGIPEVVANSEIQLVSYAGDDISFLEGGTMGQLAEDLDCGDGDIIKKDTLVIIGNYRGDPRFNTIQIQGRFTTTNAEGEIAEKTDERAIDGKVYLFAEIPADNEVSDISDGLFIFVPNVQREAELQDKLDEEGNVLTHCSGVNLLPSQIRAVLYRTDDPNNTDIKRATAETLWINSPGGDDLPTIVLESDTEGKTE